jgi:hypothetical protein
MIPKQPHIATDRDRKRRFYLCEDVHVTLGDGAIFIIEKGYRFDGHSIPFLMRSFFPVYDVDVPAAMVHDYLLDTEMFHRYKRSFIDAEYKRFMGKPEYFATKTRRWLFPKVVGFFGYIKRTMWGR